MPPDDAPMQKEAGRASLSYRNRCNQFRQSAAKPIAQPGSGMTGSKLFNCRGDMPWRHSCRRLKPGLRVRSSRSRTSRSRCPMAAGCRPGSGCRRMPRTTPVPVILEHLPYRKRDGTIVRDSLTHPWMAGQGYACIRVDMRGNGDSEGLMADEYTPQELQDACDVIAWAVSAALVFGDGRHDGDFLGRLQFAAGGGTEAAGAQGDHHDLLDGRPFCRRHPFQGRLPAGREFRLGGEHAVLFLAAAGSDADGAGDGARSGSERLENMPFLAQEWISRQTRDAYWKHGSVCEDYTAIEAAVLSIGGWHDGYRNTISHLVENIEAPVKGYRRAVDPQIPALCRAGAADRVSAGGKTLVGPGSRASTMAPSACRPTGPG
jgi:hypothetical protein